VWRLVLDERDHLAGPNGAVTWLAELGHGPEPAVRAMLAHYPTVADEHACLDAEYPRCYDVTLIDPTGTVTDTREITEVTARTLLGYPADDAAWQTFRSNQGATPDDPW